MSGEALTETAVQESCARVTHGMAVLRQFPVPPYDATPDVVHAALLDMRARLDEAESLVQEMGRRRRMMARRARAAAEEADDAYDEVLAKLTATAVRREYESIRDREVSARVKTSELRRAARAAQRLLDLVEEAEDTVRSMYFGMRDIRKELLTRLDSYLPWEASMER